LSGQRDTEPLLDGALEPRKRERLVALARRLEAERPVPRAVFRAALGRRLRQRLERDGTPPRGLGVLIAAFAGSGSCLLLVAALGVAGAGPLSA
jgi:predicted nucleic acid-binding protein